MKIKIILLCIVLSLFFLLSLNAQVKKAGFLRSNELMAGVYYQSWSSENDEQISQIAVPLTFIIPFNNQLSVDFSNSPAFSNLNKAENGLNGLNDTRFRLSYITKNEKLLFTLGSALPTGKSSLEGDQFTIASVLANNALDFRVPTLGQGLDIKGSIAFAQEAGDFVLGGGIGYLFKGGFEPFKDDDMKYTPGNELTLTAGVDRVYEMESGDVRITGDVTYTLYGKDEIDGREVFKSGNKLRVELRSYFDWENMDLLAYVRNRTKGKNERGLGSLNEESLNSNGNQLEVGGISYFPLSAQTNLKGILDTKIYSKNEHETNGAFVLGIGTGLQHALSDRFILDSQFKFLTGSLKFRDGSTGITGFEVGAMFRYQL